AECRGCAAGDFTVKTRRRRMQASGNPHADMDGHACALDALLELADRHAREGLGDAPWPPHYRKQAGEPARVQPSRRRTPKHPLIEIARSGKKDEALAGLERWKTRRPDPAAHLQPADLPLDPH